MYQTREPPNTWQSYKTSQIVGWVVSRPVKMVARFPRFRRSPLVVLQKFSVIQMLPSKARPIMARWCPSGEGNPAV
jgi:hypothetical protein